MLAIFLVIVTLNKAYPSDNYIPAPGNFYFKSQADYFIISKWSQHNNQIKGGI